MLCASERGSQVIALSGTSVLYVACDVAGTTEPSEPIQVPRDIFAREVDGEVPDLATLVRGQGLVCARRRGSLAEVLTSAPSFGRSAEGRRRRRRTRQGRSPRRRRPAKTRSRSPPSNFAKIDRLKFPTRQSRFRRLSPRSFGSCVVIRNLPDAMRRDLLTPRRRRGGRCVNRGLSSSMMAATILRVVMPSSRAGVLRAVP